MTATESYKDALEFRDALKKLPLPVKEEIMKNVSLMEAAYQIGYTNGRQQGQAATA